MKHINSRQLLVPLAGLLLTPAACGSRTDEKVASAPLSTGFVMISPAAGGTVTGAASLRVSIGTLSNVSSVEYRLNGKPMYADGDLVLPRTNGPAYDFSWHTANWFDGFVDVEALARDSAGNLLGTTPPVPFRIKNGSWAVSHDSPSTTEKVHGTVDWMVSTDYVLGTGQKFMGLYHVDGEVSYQLFHDQQHPLIRLDTTKLSNGKHELYVRLLIEDAQQNPYPTVGAAQVTIDVDNGSADMELRSTWKDVFLTPRETVVLSPRLVRTDGTERGVEGAIFSSTDTSVAEVDSNGTITGKAAGFADVTSSYQGFTSTTRVTVRDAHGFAHFTKDGNIVSAYDPAHSLFLKTMFFLPASEVKDARNPDLGHLLQQAGVNALTTGFYYNPGDGWPREFEAWKERIETEIYTPTASVAEQYGLGLYLTGDDIARTAVELADSIDPDSGSDVKIRYAMNWARTHGTIGVDMVDEVNADFLWGDTPTPTDDRWSTKVPSIPKEAFTRLMNIVNAGPRPRITWSGLGVGNPQATKNWTGNPAFSEFSGIFHDIRTLRSAYPSGDSMWQIAHGIDASTLGRNGAYLTNAPKVLLASVSGPEYEKGGPGDHFVAGRDRLSAPALQVPQVAAEIVYALIRGAAGVRVYGFDVARAKTDRLDAAIGTTGLQTGADPYGVGVERWKAMANAFNVIRELEPYILQPETHAIDLGANVPTAARSGSNGRLLVALNISEIPQTVHVDLSRYGTAGSIVRRRVLGSTKNSTETIPPTAEDTLTIEPMEAVFWIFE